MPPWLIAVFLYRRTKSQSARGWMFSALTAGALWDSVTVSLTFQFLRDHPHHSIQFGNFMPDCRNERITAHLTDLDEAVYR